MNIVEFVRGDTRRALEVTLVDRNGAPVPLDGWAVRFQSASNAGLMIDAAGTVIDSANGLCSFDAFGSLVTSDQMGQRPSLEFTGRVKGTDPGGKVAYSGELRVRLVRPPV